MTDGGDGENQREIINRKVTIKALGNQTREELSNQLNDLKCLRLKRNGLIPNWRGLFEITKLPERHKQKVANSADHTSEILNLWCESDPENSTIDKLFSYLEEIDRYGTIEDIKELVCKDIENFDKVSECSEQAPEVKQNTSVIEKYVVTGDDVAKINEGQSLKRYDAFVLFADDDIDFAIKLIETMESSQYKMQLCTKDRNLIPGDLECRSIMTLITERCNRLIVILSPAFFKSPMNNFYMYYALSYGVETQKTRVIHCVYKSCYDVMPESLRGFYMLDFTRAGKLWNFWDRLRDSLRSIDPAGAEKFLASRAEILDIPDSETVTVSDQNRNTQVLNSSNSLNSPTVEEIKTSKNKFFKSVRQKVTRKGTKTKKLEMEDDSVCAERHPTTNKSESLLGIPRLFNAFKKDPKTSSKTPSKSKNRKDKEKIAAAAS